MDNDLRLLLNRYVHHEVSLEAIESWISHNIWDAQPDIDDAFDQVAVSLIHLDEGLIDEDAFRESMMERLGVFRYKESDYLNAKYSWASVFSAVVTRSSFTMEGRTGGIPIEYILTPKVEAFTSP